MVRLLFSIRATFCFCSVKCLCSKQYVNPECIPDGTLFQIWCTSFDQSPIGPWSKVVHYMGNSVPFEMQPSLCYYGYVPVVSNVISTNSMFYVSKKKYLVLQNSGIFSKMRGFWISCLFPSLFWESSNGDEKARKPGDLWNVPNIFQP